MGKLPTPKNPPYSRNKIQRSATSPRPAVSASTLLLPLYDLARCTLRSASSHEDQVSVHMAILRIDCIWQFHNRAHVEFLILAMQSSIVGDPLKSSEASWRRLPEPGGWRKSNRLWRSEQREAGWKSGRQFEHRCITSQFIFPVRVCRNGRSLLTRTGEAPSRGSGQTWRCGRMLFTDVSSVDQDKAH